MKGRGRGARPYLGDAQLALPLLEALHAAGGDARPRAIYEAVADRVGAPEAVRRAVVLEKDGRRRLTFAHRVRWVRQMLLRQGLVAAPARGVWAITPPGVRAALNARPGLLVTVFLTPNGEVVWGRAEDAWAIVEPESVDLLWASPPYPVARAVRGYGTMSSREWLTWMLRLMERWRTRLRPSGSIVLVVGQTWVRGLPLADTFLERFVIAMEDELGLRVPQRLWWHAPAKMPGVPVQYVAKERTRLKNTLEAVLWFSPSAHPKADNRRVLVPYSASAERALRRPMPDGTVRPSGADFSSRSFRRREAGAIPSTLLTVNHSASHDPYLRACKAAGYAAHPARTPRALAGFALDLLTTAGDRGVDCFFGSGVFGEEAERRGVRWLGIEQSRRHVETARLRFADARLPEPAVEERRAVRTTGEVRW